jgi:MSHA pilin protein MshC
MRSPAFARTSGFTLLELIVIIGIIGILAVVALPRLQQDEGFKQRAFHDQTLAALRYAQKAAIAQRRTVCVTAGASGLTLSIASAAGSASCNTSLAGPGGGSPYALTAPAGVSYAAAASFSFNALGQPGAAQTFQVDGMAEIITVEAGTGYVH